MTAQMYETPKIFTEISARLAAVRRKEHLAAALQGIFITALIALAAILAAVILEEILYLGAWPRAILFWLIVALAAGSSLWYVWRPVLRQFHILPVETDAATAAKVGRHFPHIRDRLVNVLELFEERGRSEYYSAELIDASFEDLRRDIAGVEFTSIVGYAGSRRVGRILGIAGAVAVLLFVVFPAPFLGSAYRLWHYDEAFAAPTPFRLIVEPGDTEVVKGDRVRVLVRVEGRAPKDIVLASKPEGQIVFEERSLAPDAQGTFSYEFVAVKMSTVYYAYSGSVHSKEYTILVTDRPTAKLLRLQLTFPRYAKLPAKQLDDNVGDITALKGTQIALSVESNKDLSEAVVRFHDSTSLPLRVAGGTASGAFRLMKEGSYHIGLKDQDGTSGVDPVEYSMKIVPDAYPVASIPVPGTDQDIAGNTAVPMVFRITDDYGFSRLRLAYRLTHSRYEKPPEAYTYVDVPIPQGIGTEGTIAYTWSIESLGLVPEDVISYYIEVFDNDDVSGPKSSRSESYSLRLPSLDEVFNNVDEGHQVSLEAMHKAMDEAQEARKGLDKLQQDLKKNEQKMDWEDQKKAEALAKKYEDIRKTMEDVNRTVDRMMDEMQKNQVISKETLDKYQELQQLMEQINSPEFAEAMKKLQQAMQQMSPEALKQALQQFSFSEDQFRKSIERTLNLLKRIQIEQKVDEAVKRAEELAKQQEGLQNKTEKTSRQDTTGLHELAREQKDMSREVEQLKKELSELQKKMEEFPSEMPLSEMEKIADSLQASNLSERMDDIARQMEQQETSTAMQNQSQAVQSMNQLSRQLRQMKQAMLQNQQRQIVNEMRRTMEDLVDLSKRQEGLKDESQGLERNSQRFRDQTDEQMDLLNDLGNLTNRLSALSQKTFGVTPEMGKSIGDAMRQMGAAVQSLDQRNGNAAGQQQSAAMGALNEAAELVASAMDAMMQGGGQGMGMAAFMQRLQQMTGAQQKINQGTKGLGGLTPEQAAQMGRLAGEQGMVRKSLEQLQKEAAAAGQLKKMLGDLGSIAEEMHEVETDLSQGSVNPETLRKQDRILSRLLDSQRSMQERDFEKRRKSETGTNVVRAGPGALDLTTQEGKSRLRRDLLKALEEGYTRDYQELIRKYFDALEQHEEATQ